MDTTLTLPPSTPSGSSGQSYTATEDYLAIGVRPMEVRPGVIRRAMYRSATPLANLHLNHPDRGIEKQLARILTTGYRLLDPRRRQDTIQRMMLGRIHPQLADEAAHVAQSRGGQLIAFEAAEEAEFVPYQSGGLYPGRNRNRLNRQGASNHFYFLDEGMSQWCDSLRSHDLLVERPLKRAIRSTRRWFSQRFVAAGAVVGVALISFSTWRVFRAGDETAPTSLRSEEDLAVLPSSPLDSALIAGPDTADPETASPETASPKTASPETADHETAGPKTAGTGAMQPVAQSLAGLAPKPVVPASFLRASEAAAGTEGAELRVSHDSYSGEVSEGMRLQIDDVRSGKPRAIQTPPMTPENDPARVSTPPRRSASDQP